MGSRFILLMLVPLLAHPAIAHDGEFSQLEEEFEELRNILALLPEKFFQLERTLDMMELKANDGSTVDADIETFRKKFAGKIFNLVEDLFGLEANLRELYQEQPEQETDEEAEEESNETEELCGTWRLGMNMNPTDGNIMDYTTGWSGSSSIGDSSHSLIADYVDSEVWNNETANYIAIVRHDDNFHLVHAVKTFKIIYDQGYSLSEMFNSSNPEFYRQVVGLLIQDRTSIATVTYDPIFSVGGDLAINWGYSNNGVRMVMTDGYLEASGTDSFSTRGLGAHYSCDPVAGTVGSSAHGMEIASTASYGTYQYPYAIGTDYGSYSSFYSYTSSYGQYAIYVSEDASSFPGPGTQLEVEMDTC